MYRVIYEPLAENDLIEILTYYSEQSGFEFAESILERIKAHVDRLEFLPHRTLVSPRVSDAREFLIEKLPYKAFIYVNEDNKTVYVLRIIHTSRNYP
jgi:plasmid stabilization system protein ParE